MSKLPPKMMDLPPHKLRMATTIEPNLNCESMVKKCEALCCHVVPMEKDRFERNRHRLINKDFMLASLGKKHNHEGELVDHVLPLTESMRCPFNDTENGYRCNIYDDRPQVCKVYGNGLARCTSCPFFKGNGKKRSKKERKELERMTVEDFNEVAGKINNYIETEHGQK